MNVESMTFSKGKLVKFPNGRFSGYQIFADDHFQLNHFKLFVHANHSLRAILLQFVYVESLKKFHSIFLMNYQKCLVEKR